MRRWLWKPMLILFTVVIAIGAPLLMLLIALSDALEASPQPMLVMSYIFGGMLVLVLIYLLTHIRKLRRREAKGKSYSSSYLDVAELRSEVTLIGGMAVNLIYALFKFGAATYYHTLLFAAEAFYYLVLSVIRMLLVFGVYVGRRKGDPLSAWKNYRRCGWQLLLLDLSMSFVIIQTFRQSTDFVKMSAVVYGSAFWAFYRLTMAIIQLVKYRSLNRPLLSASKCINLSAACMSIYILQNTLILHFGNDELFRQRMNGGFGFVIAVTVILIALFMIITGTRKIHARKTMPTPPVPLPDEPEETA